MRNDFYIKLFFVAYLGYTSVRLYTDSTYWSLINYVNLIFHEAGHVFLSFFGSFLHILGGTLFEIGIPVLITSYFLYQRKYFSAGFGAWWSATALLGVSIYAGDAQARILPLLGGDSVGHDWFNLLTMLGILQHDQFVAGIFFTISLIILALAGYFFYLDYKRSLPGTTTHHETH